jgi:hypothetical protein
LADGRLSEYPTWIETVAAERGGVAEEIEARRAMLLWSGTRPHVQAVQWTYPRVSEVWSADWSLRHISPSASRWDGPLGDLPTGPQFPKDPRGSSAPHQRKLAVASAIRTVRQRGRSTDGV